MNILTYFSRSFYREFVAYKLRTCEDEDEKKMYAVILSLLAAEKELQIDFSTAIEAAILGDLTFACRKLAEAEGRCTNGR